MIPLLLMLLGCDAAPGNDTTNYDACLTWLEVECCDRTSDPNDPTWACNLDEQGLADWCGKYDLRYCDSEDAMFDSEKCEEAHTYATDAVLEWQRTRATRTTARSTATRADSEAWAAIPKDECGDYPNG